jgi:Cu2+-exporting ATPase
VRQVVFDKTGTLTLEAITLRNPEALDALSENERAHLLALVRESPHPVSRCLAEHLLADGVRVLATDSVRETIGYGVSLIEGGIEWRLGRQEWAGGTAADCVFSRGRDVLARFQLGEQERADAREEIAALRRHGCKVSILSGDRAEKVAALAQRLDLPAADAHAALSPQAKADWMRRHDRHDSLYLGDGANDSLAFDAAWCSGTPAIDRGLLERKADFYFLGRGLAGVRALLETAALRRRAARAAVTFAICYNGIAIGVCLAGRMNPLLAAVLMPASSIISLAIVFAAFRRRRTSKKERTTTNHTTQTE